MTGVRLATAAAWVATGLAQGCAPAPPSAAPGQLPSSGVLSAEGVPSASFSEIGRTGTLRQDQISVRLKARDVRIEIAPLAGWVLEATAPDAKRRLSRVAETYAPTLAGRTGEDDQALFLVSFSSDQPATEFEPLDLHLVSRGLRERPLAIEPVSPGWGSRRLEQRITATAVYAYPASVNLSRGLTVVYRDAVDSSWDRILVAVEAERARVPG